ncbi:MAG: aryl-sulfate sulfotransferase, partial [Rhodothermales bacterium]
MKGRRGGFMVIGLLIATGWTSTQAQEQTVGLFLNDDRAYEGYTLLPPLFHNTTYLISNDGLAVHSWEHERGPAGATYLLPNGNLLRGSLTINPALNFGGLGGRMQEVAWNGDVVWEFVYSDSLHALHHDMATLPNGNVLMIAWEYHSVADAVAAGRNPDLLQGGALWAEQIIEVRPTPPVGGEIVWKWHLWDHLIQDFDSTKANFGVVEEHPELADVNYGAAPNADWIHMNSLNYNAELDQIILSAPGFREFWVIDHSTTMEEAAGHTGGRSGKGGDFLYRWGNPPAYRAPISGDPQLRVQFTHDVQWIEPGLPGAGNILVFENGQNSGFSSVRELAPVIDENGAYALAPDGSFSPPELVWNYEQPDVFFSIFASGEQRLPNGNTLITEAQSGRIFEVTPENDIVWEYVNPVASQGPLVQGDSIPRFNPARP